MQILQPPQWRRPRGYVNGISASGRLVFVSGMIGWDGQEQFFSDDFVAQLEQALKNTLAVLAEAGARREHVVRMVWYLTDKREYLNRTQEVGKIWRAAMGRHFPTMSVVEVSALMEDRAKVEVETTAVVPEDRGAVE